MSLLRDGLFCCKCLFEKIIVLWFIDLERVDVVLVLELIRSSSRFWFLMLLVIDILLLVLLGCVEIFFGSLEVFCF